jgi:hypothetical protein
MKKENLSLLVIGAIALMVGFGGWYLYTSVVGNGGEGSRTSTVEMKDEASSQDTAARAREERVEELKQQKERVESLAVSGRIVAVGDNKFDLDGGWTVVITPETELISSFMRTQEEVEELKAEGIDAELVGREEGSFSDFSVEMNVKVYAKEKIGDKEEFEADKVVYRK